MKTLITCLLVLLLTACSAAPPAQEPVAPPEDEQPPLGTVEDVAEAYVRYQVETDVWGDTCITEDGIHLVSYTAEIPVLKAFREDGTEIVSADHPEEEQAVATVEAFNRRFESWYAEEEFLKLARTAEEDLAWVEEEGLHWYGGYELELSCDIYQTDHLVSVSGVYCSYTGGAHPNTYLLGWTFDLERGVFFGAETLAGQEPFQTAVSEEIIRQAEVKAMEYDAAPEEFFWPEYETIIGDWPSYAISFDASGMSVAFSPYELAAYAAGPQTFELSYEFLKPYLDEHGLEVLGLDEE